MTEHEEDTEAFHFTPERLEQLRARADQLEREGDERFANVDPFECLQRLCRLLELAAQVRAEHAKRTLQERAAEQ